VVLQSTIPALLTQSTTPLSNVYVRTTTAPFAIFLSCKLLFNAILMLTLVSGIIYVNMLIIAIIRDLHINSELSLQK
jgi:hypothetical protein